MNVSIYNIFGNAFFSAFGEPEDQWFSILDLLVETMFLFDMIFCFFQEYKDEETYNMVSSFRKIVNHYVRKSFVFDLVAWFPLVYFLDEAMPKYFFYRRIIRLLKLFRLPRLAQLLDVEKCKSLLNEYYGKKLMEAVHQNDNDFYFPIMKVIIAVNVYNLFSIIIIIFTISYFLGIFWLIFIRDLEDWRDMDSYDVY